jgi:hypothetical protein
VIFGVWEKNMGSIMVGRSLTGSMHLTVAVIGRTGAFTYEFRDRPRYGFV